MILWKSESEVGRRATACGRPSYRGRVVANGGRGSSRKSIKRSTDNSLSKTYLRGFSLHRSYELEQARESYVSVIDAANAKGPPSVEMTRAVDRAKEGIAAVTSAVKRSWRRCQKEADRVAEERQGEAAARTQRQAEEARMAKIQSSVSGGVVTRVVGNRIYCGMKVYLLKPECSSKVLVRFYEAAGDDAVQQAVDRRKNAAEFRGEFVASDEFASGYETAAECSMLTRLR